MFDIQGGNITTATEEDLALAAGPIKGDEKGKTKDTSGKDQPGGDDTDDKKDDKGKAGKEKKSSNKSSTKDKTGTKNVTDLSKKALAIAAGGEDDDDDDDDDDENKDDKNKGKTGKGKDEEDHVSEDDDDENEDDDDDDDENKDDKKGKGKKDEDESSDTDDDTKAFLKARAELLIKKGIWADFEGSDEVEWDEDTFAEIEVKQQELWQTEEREKILGTFGPYGSAIADYAAKGGDPEKLIDIFKEQQRVENLSIESEDDQKAVVLKYVTEFQGMKPKQAQVYINALVADKELADTAKDAKEDMELELKNQEKELTESQNANIKKIEAKRKSDVEKFTTDVNSVLSARTDIPADEKKQLLKLLTKFDKKLPNGVPVNEFYFLFAEFKKNLPNYLELVRFVNNPKKFVKSAENKGKNEATDKAFKLVRTNNQSKKVKAANTDNEDDTNKGTKKTGFRLI